MTVVRFIFDDWAHLLMLILLTHVIGETVLRVLRGRRRSEDE